MGDFTCSDANASGIISGYGKILTVQPGYITVSTSSGNFSLRISNFSRLESNKANYVASPSDKVFYRGKSSQNK
jgi:hypothetical protein